MSGLNDPTLVPGSIHRPPLEAEPSTSGVAQEPVAPHVPAGQSRKTTFGILKQDGNDHQQHPQNVVFSDDYETRFPEDPYCQETAPNARVWRAYVEEAAAFDAVYVGQARDGLDVMLVFAGLFSAVVTSFLVQASQSLQADYTAMSAILLHDLVSIQLSISGSPSSSQNITVPSVNPLQTFKPDSGTVWVNGLWVVSLTTSLVVALSAVLVKQWLHHYTSIPSGTPGARSHLRQYRFDGLQKWRVNVIIGLLPIVMHASLVLFLVGLVLFFIPLRASLAYAVGVITAVLCLLYLVSSAIPIFLPQCPYQTPLTNFFHHVCLPLRKASHFMLRRAQVLAYRTLQNWGGWIQHYLHLDTQHVMSNIFNFHNIKPSSETLIQLETNAVKLCYDTLSVDALDWLFHLSSNPTVHSLVIQSIGGLPSDVRAYADSIWKDQFEIRNVRDHLLMQFDALGGPRCVVGSENVFERLNRSFCFLSHETGNLLYFKFNMVNNEPRSMAACIMAVGEVMRFYPPPDGYRDELWKLLCTFHNVELHPLIWMKLVQEATAGVIQGDSPTSLSSQDYAHIVSLFCRVPVASPYRLSPMQSSTLPLSDALTSFLDDISDSVQDCLLIMLSSLINDDGLPPALPRRYRILYKAGQYAMLHVADELCASPIDTKRCRHLQLLANILRILNDEYFIIPYQYPSFLPPLFDLLRAIIDDTPICDYNKGSWEHAELHEVLEDSLSAILRLSYQFVSSCRPELTFPSFYRLLQIPAHYFPVSKQEPPHFWVTLQLIERALGGGDEAMYRAFIDGGWMWMLAKRYIAADGQMAYAQLFDAFARGLNSALSEFFDEYCQQQPKDFILMFVMVTASLWEPDSELLLRLCPRHSSRWDTHYATLKGIVDWSQAPNRDDLPFPLENLFNGQTDEPGEVSLDEALRRIFIRDRRQFEWAACTIVLGEAAPDPPEFEVDTTSTSEASP